MSETNNSWSNIGNNYSTVFGGAAKTLISKETWTETLSSSFDAFNSKAIDWKRYDEGIESNISAMSDLEEFLDSINNSEISSSNIVLNSLNSILKGPQEALSNVVKILDALAGNNSEATASEKMLSSVVNVCNALTACVSPVTEIGFPEIPILGDIGDFLKAILQKQKMLDSLPKEFRDQVKKKLEEEKEGKTSDEYGSEGWQAVKESGWWGLICRGAIDIVKIMSNLPFLPITILCSAVSVLIDAVSQLFNVVGLGVFNFDSLIKQKKMSFNMNIQDPGFSFDPPGNILEALVKCIPLIMNSIITLPQMLFNGIVENVKLICNGLGSYVNMIGYDENKVLLEAVQNGIWANQLSVQIDDLNLEKKNFEQEIKNNEILAKNNPSEAESIKDVNNSFKTRIEKIDKQIDELKRKIEILEKYKDKIAKKENPEDTNENSGTESSS